MKLGFFLKEAFRAMRRNAAPSFAALAAIAVTMVVVGVFIPIVQATQGSANGVRNQVEVDVYMKTSATRAEENRVRGELLGISGVKRVVFESKAQAFAQESKSDPAAYALLSSNPLPDTFHVIPANPANALAIRSAILGHHGKLLDPAIQNVSNHTSDTKKVLEVTKLVTITAALLAVLLILASVLLVGNTIRLSLYARRREVEVMKLVGATDWFIRWPFVIEGVLVGAIGSLIALIILGVMKVALLDPLAGNWSLLHAPQTIPFLWLVVILIGAGIGVSALGSGLSLRRFLRV
ncbi:permease-like cell division protein FtsX [Conexibacter sp. DBS9H8]|uniref:permease-like cell division protein FtsX n=1 Tax=Conexibacter sp. DBS9H8 TaxID=2937801 RepID=UPI00200C7686|nr:permease-like cell division protein FtsX [Conexibacter sp. DBS9H8]